MHEIDIDKWERKNQYLFFKDFDDPFMGITSNIDCTKLYKECKKNGESFFIHYIHKALKAINEIDEFKTRIVDQKIVKFPNVNGSTTVLKNDNTFSFAYFDYDDNLQEFYKATRESIDKAKTSQELVSSQELNMIYVSVIPWRNFTALKHPKKLSQTDSVPRVVFGKVIIGDNGKILMPVSVEAHHAFVDGYHASKFFNRFEELIAKN